MKIQKLTLFTQSLAAQANFYIDLLGFEGVRHEDGLHIFAGSTELIFKKKEDAPYYHFAFLIPKGKLGEAISYAQARGLQLLTYKAEIVIDFGTGTAIYFYDPSGNIVEFIDRESLNKHSNQCFSAKEVVCINEIGIPVEDPLTAVKRLVSTYGIVPMDANEFDDTFCWGGNFEGSFLVAKAGRNWLPTDFPAVPNDFDIVFETATGLQEASFRFS